MSEEYNNLLSEDDYVSLIELSDLLCVPETVIIEWIEHEVVFARLERDTYYIASREIAKAKCAVRLTRDLGVNASGIAIILEMRQRIQRLEAMLSSQDELLE